MNDLKTDGVAVGAPGATDAERAAWLADKIVAQGDYAKEAAAMLRRWPYGVRVPDAVRDQHGCIVLHNGREVCYRDEVTSGVEGRHD